MTKIHVKGVPLDMGAGRRGVDMGVSAIRLAGLRDALLRLGHSVVDDGNVEVPVVETLERASSLPYLEAIAASCKQVYHWFRQLPPDAFAVVLGGDHSIAMGSVAGAAHHGRLGVIWVDAHTDINTPDTSPSGNIHGMPLSHLLGVGDPRLLDIWGGGAVIDPADIVYIGIRSVDMKERGLIKEHGILTYTMKDIDMEGLASVAKQTIAYLKRRGVSRVHVSFDADVLDPTLAPGVGTPEPGGLTYREAHLLMELLCDAKIATSLDLVEVNPILDTTNKTAQIMVDMTSSLLGKAIL